jgi:putative membrane protein
MQKSLLPALFLLLLPSTIPPATAQSFPEQVGYVTSPPDNRTAKDFAQAVMMSNKFMIVTARLALERSRNPAVRDFATHMLAAHREIWTDMKRITDRSFVNRRITPPPVFDPPHTKMHRALLITYGPAFDRLYVSQQVQAHQELMATLQGYAGGKSGYAPLEEFARQTIPEIRNHEAMLGRIPVNGPSSSGAVAAR